MRRAGRRNDDVGQRQRLDESRHLDGLAESGLGDELARARHRSIRDDDARRALLSQPLDGGASHLAGADDEDRLAFQRAQAALCRRHRGGRDRRGCAADLSLRARRFAGGQRVAKEAVQRASERFGLRRRDVRVFDLPENFGFADQHRIEAGADAEEMFDRLMAEARVEVRLDVVAGRCRGESSRGTI